MRHGWGAGTWAAVCLSLGVMAWGGLSALSASTPPEPDRAVPADINNKRPAVIVASSGVLAPIPRSVPVLPVATQPARSWFATAVAGLGTVDAPPAETQADEDAGVRRPADATPAGFGVRRAVGTRVARATPPPPIDLGPARATAQAVIRQTYPTSTPTTDVNPSRPVGANDTDPSQSRVATAAGASRAVSSPTRAPVIRRTRVPAWGPTASARLATPQPTTTARPLAPVTTRVSFVPPAIRNGDNKWGVGVYRDSNRVLDSIRQTQPGLVLLMDPGEGWARKVRETAPNAFIVGRRYRREDDQPLDHPRERGEQMADWVAEMAVPLRGVVDAWISYNEVTAHNGFDDYRRYDEFQVAFARRLQDVHGIAAVAANDGSGAIEPEDYPRYFADAIRASQYLGVHSYSPPATARMTDAADWNALRYRTIHDALERAGIRGKQMVITESGLGDGFRHGVASDEQMADDFAWFTRELRKDPYVIGHAAFGLFNATGAWDRFELTDTNVPRLMPHLLRATPTPTRR